MIKKLDYTSLKSHFTTQVENPNWIMVDEPTNAEKAYLINEVGFPEAFYNDIADIDERPRVEEEDGWTVVLIRIPIVRDHEQNPYITVPFGMVYNETTMVTVCFHKNQMTEDFIQYAIRKNLDIKNNQDLVLRLHISSSIWFLKFLKQINQKIKLAENILEKSIRNEDLQTLFNIEKALVYFNTSLKSNDILLYKIKKANSIEKPFEHELMEDVEIEIRQAIETTKIFSDILSGMMDAYASVISNNLNIIMKRLTSISIILMIPTLVASFYGMNVPNILEGNPNGFLYVSLGSLFVALLGFGLFQRKKWF